MIIIIIIIIIVTITNVLKSEEKKFNDIDFEKNVDVCIYAVHTYNFIDYYSAFLHFD